VLDVGFGVEVGGVVVGFVCGVRGGCWSLSRLWERELVGGVGDGEGVGVGAGFAVTDAALDWAKLRQRCRVTVAVMVNVPTEEGE